MKTLQNWKKFNENKISLINEKLDIERNVINVYGSKEGEKMPYSTGLEIRMYNKDEDREKFESILENYINLLPTENHTLRSKLETVDPTKCLSLTNDHSGAAYGCVFFNNLGTIWGSDEVTTCIDGCVLA